MPAVAQAGFFIVYAAIQTKDDIATQSKTLSIRFYAEHFFS
jgi:hypothetical protein